MDWHVESAEKVMKSLGSSRNGLSEKEVQKRFARFGKNVLRQYKRKSRLKVFFGQFNSLLVWVLIAAAALSLLVGHLVDAIVIGIVILLNGGIGFFQEYKAEEIIEKLRRSLRYKVLVLRNGKQVRIDSRFLVPGDIVILNAGDNVLADCRILKSEELQANEAVLSGESFPIEKNVEVLGRDVVLADRKNMLYAGTTIVRGRTEAVVVETGQRTEFGKLAELVQTTKSEIMPLEKRVNIFSRNISIAILILVGIVFGVGILVGENMIEMFLVGVSLAVGAIPEGLPAIIAITLAVAVRQMYKVNVLIRRLPAAETLGRATVICTDKTGTLTEEELTVDEVYASEVEGRGEIGKKKVLEIGVLCNDARDESGTILGDPTEVALVLAGRGIGLDKKKLTEANVRVKEFVFDSERKMMSIVRASSGIQTSYVKGAPLKVLDRCTRELVDGKAKLMSSKRKKELTEISRKMEKRGLRVLGFGFRQIRKVNQEEAENHLIFAGFVGMIDPPREEVKDAIREAVAAGIQIKVVTGDSALTTATIVKKIGLKGAIIEGGELEGLSEEKWDEVVRTKIIFARVTPQQKLKIVEILKKQGEIVAVTGDGVNDILALKRADIGVAMGKRGSDVARDSSDMVLLDDNFASIVGAIRQGRRVFDNLKKSLKFLLAANTGDIFIIIFALMVGMPLPFLPLAILWMNLVTDSLPALALAVEPAEKNVMKRGPKNDALLSGIWKWILVAGVLNFLSVIWVFSWGNANFSLDVARTMAITTAIFFELFFAFSCKSGRSLFATGVVNNWFLILAVLISAGLHFGLVYSGLGSVFGFVGLGLKELGISVFGGLSGLVVFEGWKLVDRG
ncbi:HAD-IC family P-type ATPase [Candidatus Pacearchaeota archaeon]|nr:HAD-IC family P-type ATPase [Candidatus Pacearchaeota archaeon]